MDTQTQIDRLIELAIIQRTELKQLVEQLPQLREHLNAEVERTFEEAEPQIRTELEEFVTRQAADKTATLGTVLEAKIGELAKSLEESAQAKYSALVATRDQNATLLAQAEERIAAASAELPAKVKDIVAAELARFPRAGEIDQLRKEFAEPKSLNPRGKWQADQTYNKLDLVTINGDSYTSNIDGNRTRPSRSSADWTLVAARGTGGGGGPTSLSELTTVPSNGDLLIGSGTSWVTSNLTAGAGISITVGAGEITISATDGDITLDDGTAAAPSLKFTADTDTGLFRPSDNVVGISAGGVSRATFGATSAINGTSIPASKTLVVTTDKLSALASTSSSELAGVISDETGTGALVFANTPTLVTPNIGAATGTSVNLSGAGTFGGNLTVSGTGTSTFAGKVRWGNSAYPGYNAYLSEGSTNSQLYPAIARNLIGSTGTDYTIANGELGSYVGFEFRNAEMRWFGASGTFTTGQTVTPVEWMRLVSTGNLLLGTTTDTGEKLQVNGTGYFAGALIQLGNATVDALYRVSASNGKSSDFGDDTTGGFVRANNSQSLRFITAGNIVLTLDSSANATFAGTIKPQQAATASAPTYVKGAIYFDTTLNKLRVGGATGWETVTSA